MILRQRKNCIVTRKIIQNFTNSLVGYFKSGAKRGNHFLGIGHEKVQRDKTDRQKKKTCSKLEIQKIQGEIR